MKLLIFLKKRVRLVYGKVPNVAALPKVPRYAHNPVCSNMNSHSWTEKEDEKS
jgi:hypothetical protein